MPAWRPRFLALLTVVALSFGVGIWGARWAASRRVDQRVPGGANPMAPRGDGPRSEARGGPEGTAPRRPVARRIVSLAPSVTEALFAVGCGSRVVGVTEHCTGPTEACRLPTVGGYVTPSLEAILARRPDWVVGTAIGAHSRTLSALRRMGRHVTVVDHGHLEGVLASLETLGQGCGEPGRARALVSRIRGRIAAVRARVSGRPTRSALIVFGRTGGTAKEPGIRQVFVAGRTGLYEEILRLAGGRNAYRKRVPAFPLLSVEGLLSLDPDAIVELASDRIRRGESLAQIRSAWRRLGTLRAVRQGRLVIVTGGYGQVPGPRIFRLVEDVARALHPEAFGAMDAPAGPGRWGRGRIGSEPAR